jgi:Integral membrane protein (PIN domain superfamily)
MSFKDCFKFLWKEILYSIVTTVYLIYLNLLNNELLPLKFGNPGAELSAEEAGWLDFPYHLDLLSYNDWSPAIYFGVAFILFSIGCILLWLNGKTLRARFNSLSFVDCLLLVIAILVIIVFLFLIIVFINNPIFKAILSVLLGIILAFLAFFKKT